MNAEYHIIYSGILSLVLAFGLNINPVFSFIFFASSILIDLDHLLDYFIFYYPKEVLHPFYFLKEKVNYFFSCSWYRQEPKKVLVIFHSFEIIALFFLIGTFIQGSVGKILVAISFGFAFHLLLDIFSNVLTKKSIKKIFFYFLTYRIYNQLNSTLLLKNSA